MKTDNATPPTSAQALDLRALRARQTELERHNADLRQAQRELEAQRAHYADLYLHAPVGYCTVDAHGSIVQANFTAAALWGLPREALEGHPFICRIFMADQAIFTRLCAQLLQTHAPQSCELRMVRQRGEPFWVHLSATVAVQAGAAPQLRIALNDLSGHQRTQELRRVNQALVRNDAFSRSIMDSIGANIAVLDREGTIIAVNQPWQHRAQDPCLQFLAGVGANYLAVCEAHAAPDPAQPPMRKGIQAVLDGSATGFSLEYRCCAGGPVRWFSMNVTPLGLDHQSAVVCLSDITEKKQAEQALKDSELRWKFAIDGSGDGLWDWNLADDTVFYSRRWKDMLGYADTDIPGTNAVWESLLHPEDRAAAIAAAQACLDGQTAIYTRENRLRCKDGSYRWILSRGLVVLRHADGRPLRMIGTHTDVHTQKQFEARLLATKAEAEQANRSKSRFLAAASHDLRQPMSALALYVSVLKTRVTPEDASLVERIQNCCDSMTELLTDLLDVSKLDAGVVTPRLTDFPVDDFLSALHSVHAAEAAVKGLRLRLHRCQGVVARTDQILLGRIVNNLIANAIRYTATGGVLIACRRHANTHWIEVWDSGIGIPANKTEAIFEEFIQLGDDARNRGSGLGLAIVRKTAALLGLKVVLRSRPGRGSVFAIELPTGRALPPDAQRGPRPTTQGARQLRIGLVEDHPHVRQALVLALQGSGHQVIAAHSGQLLLDQLGTQAPDIVISDYRLGVGETGFQVIDAARRAFGTELPAVIITGDTDPALIRSMTDRGIAVHFKPLRLSTLQSFIQQVTERRST